MRFLTLLFFTALLTFSTFAQTNKTTKPLAQTFSVTSMEDKSLDLDGLKGKVVLLAFWSTRCPICAAEIPRLNQLAANFQNSDVVFIGLTTENESIVKAHLKKEPFDFNIIPNSFDMVLKYSDRDAAGNLKMGYPAYYLINQKGEIELKTSGWDKTDILNAQINRLLKSN